MKLPIDTEAKIIVVYNGTIEDAKHFARLHELEGYEIKEAYPINKVTYKVKMDGGFIDYPEGNEGESILKFG